MSSNCSKEQYLSRHDDMIPRNGHYLQIEQGFRFANGMAMKIKMNQFETLADLHGLIDLLIAKGVISSREFTQRRMLIQRELEEEFSQDPFQVIMDSTPDKYSLEPVQINCQDRIHLCKAACCTLSVPLSIQDLDERIAKWDYGLPYTLAINQEGYCIHFDNPKKRCSIYENRPATCRIYDCRNDPRIWKDFDAKIPAIEG